MSSHDERRRVAVPRRSTVGPLDADVDDPLATKTQDLPIRSPPPDAQRSQIASPTSTARDSSAPSSALDDIPSKDLSFLLDPTIYHPLPTTSVPQPFLQSINASDINDSLPTLLSRGQYRLAALHCARELCAIRDPTSVLHILNLFHTRLACLTLLSHHDLAAQESKALGDLSSAFYHHPINDSHIIPWSLRVLCVRLAAIGYGEWRKGIMGYYELAREAREELAKMGDRDNELAKAVRQTWSSRLRELGILTANLLVEMGDLECAAEHLATLSAYDASDFEDPASQRLRTMAAFIWLRVGDVAAARRVLPSPATSTLAPIHALLKMAEDDFEGAIQVWQKLGADSEDAMVAQNLAVCLLYQGEMGRAREVLEGLVESGHAFSSLTFNLATLYELSTERGKDRKMQLAEKVAAQAPSADMGWERTNADFKL